MCGRTACTLAPDQICQGCSYPSQNSSGGQKYIIPHWKDHPGNFTCMPSTNIAPSMFTPVLFRDTSTVRSAGKRDSDGNEKNSTMNYVVQPMMWSIIPYFYKGDSPKGHGYKTNNCRIEDIGDKRIFKPSLNKGQRCVVICDGFYEWQTTQASKTKQPFFVHAPQEKGIEIWNKDTWPKEDLWNEEEGWKGANLLKMAGLYSVWKSSEGETVYSYTVITMEAGDKFTWIHHRIPAILESHQDVKMWLEEKDYKKAISNLRNSVTVSAYPVSSSVNNTRNQEEKLIFPIDDTKKKASDSAGSKLMMAWLNSSAPRATPDGKKGKKEEAKESKDGIMAWLKKEEKYEAKDSKDKDGIKLWLKKEEKFKV